MSAVTNNGAPSVVPNLPTQPSTTTNNPSATSQVTATATAVLAAAPQPPTPGKWDRFVGCLMDSCGPDTMQNRWEEQQKEFADGNYGKCCSTGLGTRARFIARFFFDLFACPVAIAGTAFGTVCSCCVCAPLMACAPRQDEDQGTDNCKNGTVLAAESAGLVGVTALETAKLLFNIIVPELPNWLGQNKFDQYLMKKVDQLNGPAPK